MSDVIVIGGINQTVVIVNGDDQTVVTPPNALESSALVVPQGIQGPEGPPGSGVVSGGSYFPSGW